MIKVLGQQYIKTDKGTFRVSEDGDRIRSPWTLNLGSLTEAMGKSAITDPVLSRGMVEPPAALEVTLANGQSADKPGSPRVENTMPKRNVSLVSPMDVDLHCDKKKKSSHQNRQPMSAVQEKGVEATAMVL